MHLFYTKHKFETSDITSRAVHRNRRLGYEHSKIEKDSTKSSETYVAPPASAYEHECEANFLKPIEQFLTPSLVAKEIIFSIVERRIWILSSTIIGSAKVKSNILHLKIRANSSESAQPSEEKAPCD